MIINVTQEHIDKGFRSNACFCPVALALIEEYPNYEVSVGNPHFRVGHHRGRFQQEVADKIARFDVHGEMEPFEFECEFPKVNYKMAGDQWCATFDDFVNLQESPAGFGETKPAALIALFVENS